MLNVKGGNMKAGDRFAMSDGSFLTIKSYRSCNNVVVVFDGFNDCISTNTTLIKRGAVRNRMKRSHLGVGYLGIGPYKSRCKGVRSKAYSVWSDMLRRCYSKTQQKRQPSYIGCTVCDEWHNYQNFARWYHENSKDMTGRYDIDKDIKFPGNKVYSPDNCVIVSHKVNAQHSASKPFKVKSPSGEIYDGNNLTEFCAKMGLIQSCMSRVLCGKQKSHKGWVLA